MLLLILAAAVASVLVSEVLELSSRARSLLNASWLLAPYLVLMAVTVIAEKRTSLPAMAIVALLGAVGALTPILMMTIVETHIAARLVPIYQAGAIAVLIPACRRLTARADGNSPLK